MESIDASNEIWKPVVGFEDSYEVSNMGRVRSKEKKFLNGVVYPPKLIFISNTTYATVQLWKNGKATNKLVHRLVAEAFLPNPNNLPEVDHKDDDLHNNRLDNLQWMTASANCSRRKGQAYRKSVTCLDTGEVFSSISAASRSVNTDATRIVESIEAKGCCKGKTFVYTLEMPDNVEEYLANARASYQSWHTAPTMPNQRKVRCAETGQQFVSIAEAARFYNCDTATITNRIKAKKPFNGVTLEYVD